MRIAVPTERTAGDRRVSLTPASVASLLKSGNEVLIEVGAGVGAGFLDETYAAEGATLVSSRAELFASGELVVSVRGPGADAERLAELRDGQALLGLLNPLGDPEGMRALAERGVTAFALELLPRISRAQSMDALTSMATVAGYKAVVLAASLVNKMYPLMMTAAGTVIPARVLVIGAGVAGLQAIATANRLGAVASAYDLRPAVREQVESLGGRFVELDLEAGAEDASGYAQRMDEQYYSRQRELLGEVVAESDVVITTAAVPGSRAPLLVTGKAVRRMRPGSVVVDLAADTGGNCELTSPGDTIDVDGVTIAGPLDLAASIPGDASSMFSRNAGAFLASIISDGQLVIDPDDEVHRGTLVTRGGDVVHERVRQALGLPALEPATHGG